MIKGILAQSSLAQQLLSLFALALFGSILFSSIGLGLAMIVYDFNYTEVSSFLNTPGDGHRDVFKLVQGFATVGTFFFPAIAGAQMLSYHPEELLGLKNFTRPVWLIIILLAIASYSMGALSDLLYRFSAAIPLPEFLASWRSDLEQSQVFMLEQYQSILNMQSPLDFLQVLFVMALIPALAEESLFRGVLQPLLARHINKHAAIWISATIFGVMHNQYLAFLSITILGALLGYLRDWSQSLWLPSLLHFFNNATIVTMVYFMDYNYQEALSSNESISIIESTVLVAVLAASLALLYELSRRSLAKRQSK
jgi:membrane protease YdiL (CAAX protease family)